MVQGSNPCAGTTEFEYQIAASDQIRWSGCRTHGGLECCTQGQMGGTSKPTVEGSSACAGTIPEPRLAA